MQGSPARLTMMAPSICNNAVLKLDLVDSEALLDRLKAGDRPNLQAGCYKRSNPAAEAFQRRISASAKSQ